MNGELTPDQQMRVLTRVWGNDRDGFVFLPWIDGKCRTRDERKVKYHEGQAFSWPEDREKILKHLTDHSNDDVYFAPCLFIDKRRIETYATTEATLWADLDEANPHAIDNDYRPTIAWESSPGRYQAVWILTGPLREGTSWAGKENHRLTMYLNADPSGWDTTQLLRVPGRPNHKPEYRKANGGMPAPGQLLWDNGPRYRIRDFDELPEITTAEIGDVDLLDEDIVGSIDRHAVWARVRLKVSSQVREYMAWRKSMPIHEDMDRSEIQWQIMRDLADAGCNVAEIVAVVRPSVWNSYAGRADELKRLKIGAGKAVAAKSVEGDDDGVLEDISADRPEVRWLNDVMSVHMRRPRWLVHNVWSQSGCGFIAGDPKSYKSWMGIDLALSIATGTAFLNDLQFAVVGGPRPVIYLQEEDSEIVVRDRMEYVLEGKAPKLHWHGHMERVGQQLFWLPPKHTIPMAFFVRTGFTSSDPGWQAWLAEMAAEIDGVSIVIDTLGTTAGDVDTDRAQDLMQKILRPLKDISNQTGSAITVVHHNRKGTNGDQRGGSRMLGSVALHAWVDDALYVHSREQKRNGTTKVHVERESKSTTEHRWTVEVPRMGVGGDGARTVWEPLTGLWDASADAVTGDTDIPTPSEAPRRGQRVAGSNAASKVRLLRATEAHPVPLDRLATTMGIPAGSAWKQCQSAITGGMIAGDRDKGFWPVG